MYKAIWLDGKEEILLGNTPNEALSKAGYSQGALRVLDSIIKINPPQEGWIKDQEISFGRYGTKIIYTHKNLNVKKVVMGNKTKYQY